MNSRQRLNAALDGGNELLDVVRAGQRDDSLHDRKRILGAVINFACQKQLPFLYLLAIRDIHRYATDADDLAPGVYACRRCAKTPPCTAVLMANAKFDLMGAGVLSRLPDCLKHLCPIVTVNQLPKTCERYLERCRIDAEYSLLPLIPGAVSPDKIPIPGSHFSRSKRNVAASLASPQAPGRPY